MESPEIRKSKRILYVFDGVIAALCVVAMIGYFLLPVWRVQATLSLRDAALSLTGSMNNEFADAALSELSEEDLTVALRFRIPTIVAVASVFTNDRAFAERQKTALLSALKNSASDSLRGALPKAARPLVKMMLEKMFSGFLAEKLPQEADHSLESLGVTDRMLGEHADRIVDELMKEQVDANAVAAAVTNTFSALVGKASEQFPDARLNEAFIAEKKDLNDAILSTIAEFTGGRTAFRLSDLLFEKLEGEIGLDGETQRKIDNYTTLGVTVLLKVIGLLVIFSILCLLYPVVKITVKLIVQGKSARMRNPGVVLTLPLVCGWLPELVLVFIPGLALLFLSASKLLLRFVDSNVSGYLSQAMGALRISFFSSGVIAFICVCLLFVLCFFNAHFRRKLKRLLASGQTAPSAPPAAYPPYAQTGQTQYR